MQARYYALRRVNPYRGVIQVVEVGDAMAQSYDGLNWHLRTQGAGGRPTGIWVEGGGLQIGAAKDELLLALGERPALPFALVDTQELWLLHGESGLPLALLACDRQGARSVEPPVLLWHPFVASHTGFHSPTLAAQGEPQHRHRDLLAGLVNQAAGPTPAAQWFQRDGHGQGVGLSGPHIARRELPPEAFPELLVRECLNSRLENSVIADYHTALALLTWPRLSLATRARLEILACENPRSLARIHRLLPSRVDEQRIQAALVAARLIAAAEPTDSEQDWN